jgi:hypothetical protein
VKLVLSTMVLPHLLMCSQEVAAAAGHVEHVERVEHVEHVEHVDAADVDRCC